MKNNKKICVVIPCYKASNFIIKVINSIPDYVDLIIVIDDLCPEKCGKIVEKLNNDKIIIIFNSKNEGVGGATIKGFEKSIEMKMDYTIKMDADGQMDSNYIYPLIMPLIEDKCDFSKGNRLYYPKELKKMPMIRLFGNSILSFFVKFASGYWDISDTTNGYIALKNEELKKIDLDSISKNYFFEINLLIESNIKNLVINEVKMPSIYNDEKSNLKIKRIIITFPFLLLKGLVKRIFFKYFIYDFNIASVYIISGMPLFFFGIVYGIINWMHNSKMNYLTPTGTIMISLLSIILGFQLLLQAISIDVMSTPKKK